MNKCALLLLGLLWACSRLPAPVTSPSGKYTVVPRVAGPEAGPQRQYCLRLDITVAGNQSPLSYQTGASSLQKWALAWSPTDALVLYSSDIGIFTFDIHAGSVSERQPTPEEAEIGRKAYEAKYGKRPRT